MDADDRSALLGSDFLAPLAPEERERVAGEAAPVQEVAKGRVLFHQGDEALRMYFLVAGRVKLSQVSAQGQEVIVRFVAPGEMFGGLAVLGTGTYPVTGELVEAGRVLSWGRDALARLAADIPALALSTAATIGERMREVQDRYRELATERVAQRIARSLLRLVRQAGRRTDEGVLIDLPLSRRHLAEMNGTTLYTVSRVLSQWEGEGIVAAGRERVVVKKPHELVAVAEDLPER